MDINELKNKPLWQMTGEEFLAIINEKKSEERPPVTSDSDRNATRHYVYGLAGIARLFGCNSKAHYCGIIPHSLPHFPHIPHTFPHYR